MRNELRCIRLTSAPIRMWILVIAALGFVGCDLDSIFYSNDAVEDTYSPPEKESVSTVQQEIAIADFESLAATEPEIQTVVDWAYITYGFDTYIAAGKMTDDEGVSLTFGVRSDAVGGTGLIVYHCDGTDCVAALQLDVGGEQDIQWLTPDGEIAVRTMKMPLLLRDVDPDDPLDIPVIAPLEETGEADSISSGLTWSGKADGTPTDPNRKLRFVSIFGKYVTWQGPSFSNLQDSMKKGGFPDTQTIYHVNTSEIDTQLSTLGRSDALVWLGHGERSEKTKTVVGMSTAKYYWLGAHYNQSRMKEQLLKNTSGGPGIVFLAGCMTEDLIPVFDNGSRIVLGFKGKIMPGRAFSVVKAFFDALAAGKTIQEAIDAGNALLSGTELELKVNSGVDLTQKLVDVGSTTTCSKELAKSWQGTMTVTKGTDKVMVGMTTGIACGDFVLALGKSQTCGDCYLSGNFKDRKVGGCAEGNTAELYKADTHVYIWIDLNLINNSSLSVSVSGDDSDGNTFVRTGTLSPCN